MRRRFGGRQPLCGTGVVIRVMCFTVSSRKAVRTMVVRATSPKVPICGRPEGPCAGLEQGFGLAGLFQPRHEFARFLEGPGVGLLGERAQVAWLAARSIVDVGTQEPRKLALSRQNAK